ncbi:hypothetical protein [Streptomyces sp. NPDC055085]
MTDPIPEDPIPEDRDRIAAVAAKFLAGYTPPRDLAQHLASPPAAPARRDREKEEETKKPSFSSAEVDRAAAWIIRKTGMENYISVLSESNNSREIHKALQSMSCRAIYTNKRTFPGLTLRCEYLREDGSENWKLRFNVEAFEREPSRREVDFAKEVFGQCNRITSGPMFKRKDAHTLDASSMAKGILRVARSMKLIEWYAGADIFIGELDKAKNVILVKDASRIEYKLAASIDAAGKRNYDIVVMGEPEGVWAKQEYRQAVTVEVPAVAKKLILAEALEWRKEERRRQQEEKKSQALQLQAGGGEGARSVDRVAAARLRERKAPVAAAAFSEAEVEAAAKAQRDLEEELAKEYEKKKLPAVGGRVQGGPVGESEKGESVAEPVEGESAQVWRKGMLGEVAVETCEGMARIERSGVPYFLTLKSGQGKACRQVVSKSSEDGGGVVVTVNAEYIFQSPTQQTIHGCRIRHVILEGQAGRGPEQPSHPLALFMGGKCQPLSVLPTSEHQGVNGLRLDQVAGVSDDGRLDGRPLSVGDFGVRLTQLDYEKRGDLEAACMFAVAQTASTNPEGLFLSNLMYHYSTGQEFREKLIHVSVPAKTTGTYGTGIEEWIVKHPARVFQLADLPSAHLTVEVFGYQKGHQGNIHYYPQDGGLVNFETCRERLWPQDLAPEKSMGQISETKMALKKIAENLGWDVERR